MEVQLPSNTPKYEKVMRKYEKVMSLATGKWHYVHLNIKKGNLVLLKDNKGRPNVWPKALDIPSPKWKGEEGWT